MTNTQNAEKLEKLNAIIKEHPCSFWAKRLDTHVHIAENGKVLCGRYSAMLGNNYAPDLAENNVVVPVCPACLGIYCENHQE